MGKRDIKDAKQFIANALSEAKLGHNEFSTHKTEYQQQSEGQIISQAIEDIQDTLIIPPCPDCGGHLIFTDKSKGGGIICIGKPEYIDQEGEWYIEDNGCGFRGYTLSITNPVKLERL